MSFVGVSMQPTNVLFAVVLIVRQDFELEAPEAFPIKGCKAILIEI